MKLMQHLMAAALIGTGGLAAAECATDDAVAQFVADFTANTPTPALVPDGDMADGFCTQAKLVEALSEKWGPVIGYKAGLTSDAAQDRFGVSEPVMGVLYRDMMEEDGVTVANWGSRPLFEADLILVVGDEAINEAIDSTQAMQHVSAIRPFIELPDLAYADGEPVTGVTLTAMGVAAKKGVLGAEIAVEDAQAMHAALGAMQVQLSAADGEVLADVPGASVLGHPANAIIWLLSSGVTLKAGDMVSVGSFGPLMPPAKGKGGASVTYIGLPGDPAVSVIFE